MNFTQIMVLVFVAIVVVAAYLFWDDIKDRFGFRDSETVFLSRLQLLVGALMSVNLAPALPPDLVPYYVIGMGILGELLRKNRTNE